MTTNTFQHDERTTSRHLAVANQGASHAIANFAVHALQRKSMEGEELQLKSAVQLATPEEDELQMKPAGSPKNNTTSDVTQRKDNATSETNHTGMPDPLKVGIENLSGFSMDDVKVHYNSDKPAQLNALAYAQGTNIHIGSGQERHLPHEAWHVVQQKQGRVRPTMQMKGTAINDDEGLEKEADVMGDYATHIRTEKAFYTSKYFSTQPLVTGVIQHIKGLKQGQKVKVHTGKEKNAIQSGIIEDVFSEAYKVKMNNGLEAPIIWFEEVVYPENIPDQEIDELNRDQVKRAISNEKLISFSPSLKASAPYLSSGKKEKGEEIDTDLTEKESKQGNQLSLQFLEIIKNYINRLKEVGKSGTNFSFDGKKIFMPESCGAKIRENVAKEFGIRYDKRDKTVSFKKEGDIETVSVENTKNELQSHSEVENNLRGEFEKALGLGLGEELSILKSHPDIKTIIKKNGKILSGDIGEIRAANKLRNIFDKIFDSNYLIIGSVHFWGSEGPSTSLRDVGNELDHMVVKIDKDKFVISGIYNTKAGSNQQSKAKKQNENAGELLRKGTSGEYEWTVSNEGKETTYRLREIKGYYKKGPEEKLGKPFILPLGNYIVDDNLKEGTIGASKSYDFELPHSGVLANALNYLIITENKKSNEKPLISNRNDIADLESRLRGKAIFEAEQEGEHFDEFADWDELWEYLDRDDQIRLKEEWNK